MRHVLAVLALMVATTVHAQNSVLVWTFDNLPDGPLDAHPLANGDVVYSDTNFVRDITPTFPSGGVVGNVLSGNLTGARRLTNGDTLTRFNNGTDEQVGRMDPSGTVNWFFGTGSGLCTDTTLNAPADAIQLSGGDYLISDTDNRRIIRVDASKNKVWQYGRADCGGGTGPNEFQKPKGVHEQSNGNILVVDSHRVVEIQPTLPTGGNIVRSYGSSLTPGSGPGQLRGPHFAEGLPNGNWLIADTSNHRVIETAPDGSIVWQYGVTGVLGAGDGFLHDPTFVRGMPNGNVLIADYFNLRLLIVSPLTVALGPMPPLEVGVCSPPVDLRAQDTTGAIQTAPGSTPVTFVANGGLEMFSDAGCTALVSTSTLGAGQVFLRANNEGTGTVTVSAPLFHPSTHAWSAAFTAPSGGGAGGTPPGTPPGDNGGGGPGVRLMRVGWACNTAPFADGATGCLVVVVLRLIGRRRMRR
ncbi:MAG: NHL repeat-containing protein [Myxococcaceae bacterium]